MPTILLPLNSDARDRLVRLAQAFDRVNELCLDQANRDFRPYHPLKPVLSESDVTYLKSRLPSPMQNDDLGFLINILSDLRAVPVWRKVVKSMILWYDPTSPDNKARRLVLQIRQMGLEVLDQQEWAAEFYNAVTDVLENEAFHVVHEAIRTKINQLGLFAEIGDSKLEKRAEAFRRYNTYAFFKETMRGSPVATAYEHANKVNVTYLFYGDSVFVALGACCDRSFDFSKSSSRWWTQFYKGCGFLAYARSTMLTCLGIGVGILPDFLTTTPEAKLRDRTLAAVGISCAIVSCFLHIYVTPTWSAVAAYGAKAIQVYMALQLTSQIAYGAAGMKVDWRLPRPLCIQDPNRPLMSVSSRVA